MTHQAQHQRRPDQPVLRAVARPGERLDQPSIVFLSRSGGWFAIAGGLLLSLDAAAHFFVEDTVAPSQLLGLSHELWHLPGIIGIMAATIGLIAIFVHEVARTGYVGKAGFVLLLVGVTVGAAYSSVFHAVFMPALEQFQEGLFQDFIDQPATTAQVVRGISVQAGGLGLGAILFGAATIRARVLPRLGGWLLIAAALFGAANEAFAAAQLISRILFAAAFVHLGAAIRKPCRRHNTANRKQHSAPRSAGSEA